MEKEKEHQQHSRLKKRNSVNEDHLDFTPDDITTVHHHPKRRNSVEEEQQPIVPTATVIKEQIEPTNDDELFLSNVGDGGFSQRFDRLNNQLEIFEMLHDLRRMVAEGKLSKSTYDEIHRLQIQHLSSRRESAHSAHLQYLAKKDHASLVSQVTAIERVASDNPTRSTTSSLTFLLPSSPLSSFRKKNSSSSSLQSKMKNPTFSPMSTRNKNILTSGSNNNNNKSESSRLQAEKPIMTGFLFKRGSRNTRNWRHRFFALFSSRVEYFVSAENFEVRKPKGVMWFTEEFYVAESLITNPGNEKTNGFFISDFRTTLYLASSQPDIKHSWMFAMTKALRRLQEFAEEKDEPLMIDRPFRTASVVEHDANIRHLEYQRHLKAYGVDSPIDLEERILSGIVPKFQEIPPVIRLPTSPSHLKNPELHVVLPTNFAEPAELKQELGRTILQRRTSSNGTSSPPPPPLAPRPSAATATATGAFTQLTNQENLSIISIELRQTRRLVDAAVEEHESIRNALSKANAEDSKIAKMEKLAMTHASEAEERLGELLKDEQRVLKEIDSLEARNMEIESRTKKPTSSTGTATVVIANGKDRHHMSIMSEDGSVLDVNEASPALLATGSSYDFIRSESKEKSNDNDDATVGLHLPISSHTSSIPGDGGDNTILRSTSENNRRSMKGWLSSRVPTNHKSSPKQQVSSQDETLLRETAVQIQNEWELMNIRLFKIRQEKSLAEKDHEDKVRKVTELASQRSEAFRMTMSLTSEFRDVQQKLSALRELETKLMKTRNQLRDAIEKEQEEIARSSSLLSSSTLNKTSPNSSSSSSNTAALTTVNLPTRFKKDKRSVKTLIQKLEIAEYEGELIT